MSGPPYNGQGGQGQGQGNNPPTFNPALLNANAALVNFSPNHNHLSPSPFPNLAPSAPISQQANFSPEQLARLTDFHRRSPQQNAPSPGSRPPMPPNQMALVSIMPPTLVQSLMEKDVPFAQKLGFIDQWALTEQGKTAIAAARTNAASSASAASSAQGTTASPNQVFGRQGTLSPASHPGVLGSPHQLHARTLGNMSPESPQSTLQSPEQADTNPSGAEVRRSPKKQDVPITQAFNPFNHPNLAKPLLSPMPTVTGPIRPDAGPRPIAAPNQPPPFNGVQWIRPAPPANPEPAAPRTAPPRRREEGMRGSMRSELSRLMYASGDVENPEIDTIDYMEDLVIDWLAELCTPPPPVRTGPSAPLVAPRLDYNVIRHRLSRPSMRKYLDRFEYMEYKAVDMRSARRVARGNFEPVDQKDLDTQLEDGFLDGEDSGQVGAGSKRKRKFQRGSGPGAGPQGQGQDKDKGKGGEGEKEKRKPGPRKGWKAGLGNEGQKGRKQKRARQSTAQSASSRGPSVKPEEP